MNTPNPRTLVVLGSLVAGMTLTALLLIVLVPGPVAPLGGAILQQTDARQDSEAGLFGVTRERDWQAIVIHDSGSMSGSAESLNELHERLGRGGLGYHMVVNNGTGEADGTIELGFRWREQFDGAYLDTGNRPEVAAWYHGHAIGICVVGDVDQQSLTEKQFQELLWLVQTLQDRYGIDSEHVYVDMGADPEPARRFPYAAFRDKLLGH